MKRQSDVEEILDEMWAIFGDEMKDIVEEFQTIKEKYPIPEDLKDTLSKVEEFTRTKQ